MSFVVQKHAARHLHYDFRLELDGVLVSWAVPKGPSLDPADKRLAVRVEDHPVAYGSFEGTIPAGQYGAGTVIVWDRGRWLPKGDPRAGLAAGKLEFELSGEKLTGTWELIRLKHRDGERQESWLLIKKRDEAARSSSDFDVVSAQPDSVLSRSTSAAAPGKVSAPRAKASAAKADRTARTTAPPAERRPVRRARRAAPAVGARKAALPFELSPQLATPAATLPASGDWRYEIKFDGYRVLARLEDGGVRLLTRTGKDWTAKMRPLADAVSGLSAASAWLDGEVVALQDGSPNFNALQNAFDASRPDRFVYYLFDLPYLDGWDLRGAPLHERRRLLRALLEASPNDPRIRFSDDVQADPREVLDSACRMKLEGLIAKRADSEYVGRRSDQWLKLKCGLRQEFVVAGFTERKNSTGSVGSLLLGYYEAGTLIYAGNVGTGWTRADAAALRRQLDGVRTDKAAFETPRNRRGRWATRAPAADVRWVEPVLVAEVAFAEWTPDGSVRQASFQGLRDDKPAAEVVREPATYAGRAPAGQNNAGPSTAGARTRPPKRKTTAARAAATPQLAPANPTVARAGRSVTHPERVVDATSGLTKLDLVRYYERVAPALLEELGGRPLSVLRAPSGIGGPTFFQKHPQTRIPGVTALPASLWPDHEALMQVDDVDAIAAAAQMNVIEFHTWNARSERIGAPDRMVFDLDPGEGAPWEMVQQAAQLTRALVEEVGLVAFLKTSGGKGLHVVVPLKPAADWDTVRGFSKALVVHLATVFPQRFSARPGAAHRVGKVFVDYLRNGFGATTAAAYSARARPGLGVSMPVEWERLPDLKSGAHWTVADAADELEQRASDPWHDYGKSRRPLAPAMTAFGYTPGRSRR